MKDFWIPLQGIIKDFCAEFDTKWQVRKRVIDSHFLVLFIFKLVLSKNRQGYKSLLNELWEKQELIAYQRSPLSSSSLCEARQKLPEEIFIGLNKMILLAREKSNPFPTWCGHRVFAADGSKLNLPRELLLAGYKAPNREQYYPQGLLSVIYHLGAGIVYDCVLSANENERHCMIEQMASLKAGDVLVLDRGYFSYLLLYQAIEKNIHLICRLQFGTMNEAVKAIHDSHLTDTVINYYPSATVKKEIKQQGYALNYKPIKLRLIKYKINDEVYIFATTLIGEQYPQDDFPLVYHGRWGIEELYKISKEFIDIEDFHSKTERGVKQELYAHILLINIARIFETEANNHQPPSSSHPAAENNMDVSDNYWLDFLGKVRNYKVNFKNCLLVIGRHIEKLVMPIKQERGNWVMLILNSISHVRQKIRPGRHYPRRSRKPYNRWQSSNTSKPKAVAVRT